MLISIMILPAFAPWARAQAGPGVFKSYTLVKTDLTVNEPIFLKFSVENRLPWALTIGVGYNVHGCCSFHTRLTRPDGQPGKQRPGTAESELIPSPEVPVEPFTTFSKLLLLNKQYRFDIPGRYILDITNEDPPGTAANGEPPLPAEQRVIIDVGPRDPLRLRRICDNLKDWASSSPSRQDFDAAEVLVNMEDPVAVPYMGRLINAREQSLLQFFGALKRIADASAVDVLMEHVDSKDEEVRTVARGVLKEIENETRDPMIRLKIRDLRR